MTMKQLIISLLLLITLSSIAQNINSVENTEYNHEFIVEVAFNLDKEFDEVTQRDFDERYADIKYQSNGEIYYIYAGDPERPYGCFIKGNYEEFWELKDMLAFIDNL